MSDLLVKGVTSGTARSWPWEGWISRSRQGAAGCRVFGLGKSTLLRLIAGFEKPDEGIISFGDELLANSRMSVPAHKRGIGIVSQEGALFPHLDIAENIGFGMDKGPGREGRILDLLHAVELSRDLMTRRPHQLSGGQQQRVALARALACRPRLMLLDEPFPAWT